MRRVLRPFAAGYVASIQTSHKRGGELVRGARIRSRDGDRWFEIQSQTVLRSGFKATRFISTFIRRRPTQTTLSRCGRPEIANKSCQLYACTWCASFAVIAAINSSNRHPHPAVRVRLGWVMSRLSTRVTNDDRNCRATATSGSATLRHPRLGLIMNLIGRKSDG